MADWPIEPTKQYNFAAQTVQVNGFKLSGWSDDGSVSYSAEGQVHTHANGATGQTVISKQNDPRLIATITVRETGRAAKILHHLLHVQQASPTSPPLTYVHRDPIQGDIVQDPGAFFVEYPDIEKSREAGDREFTLLLPNGLSKVKPAGQTGEGTIDGLTGSGSDSGSLV